jgi:hypothetical protein
MKMDKTNGGTYMCNRIADQENPTDFLYDKLAKLGSILTWIDQDQALPIVEQEIKSIVIGEITPYNSPIVYISPLDAQKMHEGYLLKS